MESGIRLGPTRASWLWPRLLIPRSQVRSLHGPSRRPRTRLRPSLQSVRNPAGVEANAVGAAARAAVAAMSVASEASLSLAIPLLPSADSTGVAVAVAKRFPPTVEGREDRLRLRLSWLRAGWQLVTIGRTRTFCRGFDLVGGQRGRFGGERSCERHARAIVWSEFDKRSRPFVLERSETGA